MPFIENLHPAWLLFMEKVGWEEENEMPGPNQQWHKTLGSHRCARRCLSKSSLGVGVGGQSRIGRYMHSKEEGHYSIGL